MPEVNLPCVFPSPLRTARLALRTMQAGDIDDIHAYHSLPEVCRYVPFEPRSRDEVAEKVKRYSRARVIAAEGDYWQLAVERLAEPGRVVGDLYFAVKDVPNATAEIGWVLNPDHHGNGYITEAAHALLGLAFGNLGLHRVMANLDPRNGASAAVCARLGMRHEAHHLEDMWFKGAWADTDIYAILASEWSAEAPHRL